MDLLQNVDKVQKNICGTVDLTLAVSFEPFAHRQSVVLLLCLFHGYYFGNIRPERTQF